MMLFPEEFEDSSDEDDSKDLFGLTNSNKIPPRVENVKKPAQRVKYFEPKCQPTAYYPDLDDVVCRLRIEEGAKKAHINKSPFQMEMKEIENRIQKVKKGVPLSTLIQNDKNRKYPFQKERFKYNGVGNYIESLPQISPQQQLKKVQFVLPVYDKGYQRLPLTSRINTADATSKRLRKILNDADEFELRAHNEMVAYINHANERRERAIKQFYEDANKYGFEEAEKRAKRATQKSRLRVMTQYQWWEEFLDFAFEKPVGRNEERIIEKIAKASPLSSTVFIGFVQEVNNAKYNNERCLALLNWVNRRCQLVDDNVLNMVQEPSRPHTGRPSRRSVPPQTL